MFICYEKVHGQQTALSGVLTMSAPFGPAWMFLIHISTLQYICTSHSSLSSPTWDESWNGASIPWETSWSLVVGLGKRSREWIKWIKDLCISLATWPNFPSCLSPSASLGLFLAAFYELPLARHSSCLTLLLNSMYMCFILRIYIWKPHSRSKLLFPL